MRMVYYDLMFRLRINLSATEIETRKNDNSDLLRLADDPKIPIELPDNAGGSAEMQIGSSSETIQGGYHGNSREELRGL